MNSIQSLVNTSIKKDHADFLTEEGKERKGKGEQSSTETSFCAKNDSQGSVRTWKGVICKMAAVYCQKQRKSLCCRTKNPKQFC